MSTTRCLLAAVLASLVGCSATLRRAAQASEVVAAGSLACDGLSTRYAIRSGRYFETNPMIGEFPSDGALAGYFGAGGAAVVVVNEVVGRALPHHEDLASVIRVALNAGVVAVEADALYSNGAVGVPPCGL